MASVLKDGRGWRIRFYNSNGDRKQIRISGITKVTAEQIGRHVDALNASRTYGGTIDRQTAVWLSQIGQTLHDKLASVGLVEQRESCVLGLFLKNYLQQRHDAKPATIRKMQSAVNHLVEHFADDRELRSIRKGDADEFRSYLYSQGLAENSVRRYCGLAKQFLRAAMRKGLIEENPFADQVAAVRGNASRFYFVSREDAAKILKHCPDVQWKMIFALCRFGGLRCPSEVLALRWKDIAWQEKRFTVRSSKTEHHEGKATRVVPLFPELATVLNEGYELAFEAIQADADNQSKRTVSGPVITRYRDSTQNLRTTFGKILKRAGLKPWPKLLQNLRSTRETELAESFPLQAVTSWMGNSQLVAAKHYLQLRDEHFDRAANEITHPAPKTGSLAPQAAPQTNEDKEPGEPNENNADENVSVFGSVGDSSHGCVAEEWAMRDSNPRPPRCKRGALAN